MHELGVDPRLELVAADGGEHRVDVLDELESFSVEQLVLLLDTERVRVARAELVVDDAPAGSDPLPVIDGRERLLRLAHGRTASTSISTFHLGIEEPGEDGRVRGSDVAEDLRVSAGEAVEVVGVR